MIATTTPRCASRTAAWQRALNRLLRAIRRSTLLLVMIACLVPAGARADLETAIQRFNGGEREAGLAELHKLAEAGDTRAKYTLGVIYTQGQGVDADHEQAVKWFQEAANEGYSSAQYSLGMLHADGIGVPRDLVRGLMWLNLALADRNSHPVFRLQIVSRAALIQKSMTPEQIAEARELAAAWQPGQE